MTDLPVKKRKAPVILLIALLWIAAVPLGIYAVYNLHALSILSYQAIRGEQGFTLQDYQAGRLIGYVALLIGGIAWLAAIVGSGEFHMKHAGERRSWIIALWILGVEILLIILGLIFVRVT